METVHEPELIDLLQLHKKDIFNSLHCHAVATIQSYDKASKTCKATFVYKKTVSRRNNLTQSYYDSLEDYPILINCPVINLSGGQSGLRLPIKKDDIAIILFNDKDIDNWFLGKQSNGAVATKRTHHISDGIALVGLFSKNDANKDYQLIKERLDEDRAVLFNGSSIISLNDESIIIEREDVKITLGEKIKIENSMGSFMPTLLNLIQNLTILTTSALTTSPGNPVSTNPSLVTSINNDLTKLQGLLE